MAGISVLQDGADDNNRRQTRAEDAKHRRRNLTPSQRAAVAAEAIHRYSNGARERQGTRNDLIGTSPPPGGNVRAASAAKDAAKDMGSSERSVERAVFVRRGGVHR